MNSFSTDARDIRKFGLAALLFFGALAIGVGWQGKLVSAAIFACLALLGVLFILMPVAMKPVYSFWLRWGHIIGRGITVVFLTLIFYLVITPYAIVIRSMGKRPLPWKPDPDRDSYWIPRAEQIQPKFRFFKRY